MSNNRVTKILNSAEHHGYKVRKSEVAEECWVIEDESTDRALLVYGGSNHSCMIFLTSGTYMPQITQRSALNMLATKSL